MLMSCKFWTREITINQSINQFDEYSAFKNDLGYPRDVTLMR